MTSDRVYPGLLNIADEELFLIKSTQTAGWRDTSLELQVGSLKSEEEERTLKEEVIKKDENRRDHPKKHI